MATSTMLIKDGPLDESLQKEWFSRAAAGACQDLARHAQNTAGQDPSRAEVLAPSQAKEHAPRLAQSANGAFISFAGIVRSEENLQALSYEIEEKTLKNWFAKWAKRAQENASCIFMAHSKGDVPVGAIPFMCAVASPKRGFALKTIEAFIEDLKQNAPIWKYDLKNGERIFDPNKAQAMDGSGLLA